MKLTIDEKYEMQAYLKDKLEILNGHSFPAEEKILTKLLVIVTDLDFD